MDIDKVEKYQDNTSISLRGRNLTSAILARADIRHADFTGANLSQANLNGAKLQRAKFDCAQTARDRGPNFENDDRMVYRIAYAMHSITAPIPQQPSWPEDGCAWLEAASLDHAKMQGASLNRARLYGASLSFTELQGADLLLAQMQGAFLIGTQLQGASLKATNLMGTVINGVELQGAAVEGLGLHKTNLIGAFLRKVGLQGATVEKPALAGAELNGVSLYRFVGEISIDTLMNESVDFKERGYIGTFHKWRDDLLALIQNTSIKEIVQKRLDRLDPSKSDPPNSISLPKLKLAIAKRALGENVDQHNIEILASAVCFNDKPRFVLRGLLGITANGAIGGRISNSLVLMEGIDKVLKNSLLPCKALKDVRELTISYNKIG